MNLFVYGTLRPGGRFWSQVAPWVDDVSATVRLDGLNLFAGPGYPLAAESPEGWGAARGVVGEVLSVDDATSSEALGVVDRIEGEPHLFRRIERGGWWAYVATPSTLLDLAGQPIPTGDWFDLDTGAREAWEETLRRAYVGPEISPRP